MLTATLPNALTTLSPLNLSNLKLSTLNVRANPETSFSMYQHFRAVIPELINTNSANLFYRAFDNDPNSHNGEAIHEKFIYQGQSILDISMGLLDYPWHAADDNPLNEITKYQLRTFALQELDPLINHRLTILANLSDTLLPSPFTRYYHYQGIDGVRALTIVDEINSVKLNIILSYTEDLNF